MVVRTQPFSIIFEGKTECLNNDTDKAAILWETYETAREYCKGKYGFDLQIEEVRNTKNELVAQILRGV